MESVRARPRDDVRGRTQRASELGIGAVRDDAELADRVYRRLKNESAIDAVEVICAVDEKIVRFRSLAVDRVGLAVAQRSASLVNSRRQGNYSGLQEAKL